MLGGDSESYVKVQGDGSSVALNTGEGSGADGVPNTTGTPFTLTIGDSVAGFVNTPTDQDWFRVNLVAGQTYNFSLTATSGDLDCWVEVRDANGLLLALDDDGGPALNSSLNFLCVESGVYYVSAQAYNDATQTSTGGYLLTSGTTSTPQILNSIDWGTSVASPNSVTVYFATAGQSFGGYTSQGWNAYEQQQAMLALQQYANVANLTFSVAASSAGATFKLVTTTSSTFLGQMSPPGEASQGIGIFATNGSGWATAAGGGLEQGGQGFATLIHEFGHGLGLAHPHDNGGTSEIMQRVTSAFNSYGLFNLNQGVYTTMSYTRGWQTSPNGQVFSTQYSQGGPMALDVALIQQKYGANLTAKTGDDTYQLPLSNTITTFYSTIWDAAGNDTIAFAGSANAHIYLTAATIDYTATGGGPVSFVDGVFGGLTIARGVVIENATGGSGNDTLEGNAAANVLSGGGGNDTIHGLGGADTINGGAGSNTLYGDDGDDTFQLQFGDNDTVYGGAGDDSFYFGAAFTAADIVDGGAGTNDQIGLQGDYSSGLILGAGSITGVEVIAVLPGFNYSLVTVDQNVAAGDQLAIFGGSLGASDTLTFNGSAETDGAFRVFGGAGTDTVTGGAGNDGFYFGPGKYGANDIVNGGAGANDQLGLDGNYTLTLGANVINIEVVVMIQKPNAALNTFNISAAEVFVSAGQIKTIYGVQVVNPLTFNGSAEKDGAFRVFGGQGADTIITGEGADWIRGGLGADTITGGLGADTFAYDAAAQSTSTTFDNLISFNFAQDQIDLPGTHDTYSFITVGRLDAATFDADLSSAMTGLIAGQSIFFTPNTGSYAGQTFLVADGDGVAGYQSGNDYVIHFDVPPPSAPPPDFII